MAMLLVVCQAPETHLKLQEIVYLTMVNGILDYVFTGNLKMLYPVAGTGYHASIDPFTYCISAPKPWDSDVPLRTLDFNANSLTNGRRPLEKLL